MLLLLGFGGLIATTVFVHENIHQRIYSDYGLNSTITYTPMNFFKGGFVAYTEATGNISQCDMGCETAHEVTEVIGGYFEIVILILFVSAATILNIVAWRDI